MTMLDRYDQDLLLEYLEGELEGERLAQFEAQLAEDPQLASLLGEMARDRATLRALPREQAPAELVGDVTMALERRMLLDDAAADGGTIPIARGRDLPLEPSNGVRWGRVAGLTGLAASVAIAAGIVVFTQDKDPLIQTAQRLAQQSPTDADSDAFAAAEAADPGADLRPQRTPAPETPTAPQPPAQPAALAAGGDDTDAPGETGARGLTADINDHARLARLDGLEGVGGDLPSTVFTSNPNDAFAFAATPPRQQLVLYSEEPVLTREQLVELCVNNNIPIVQAKLRSTAPAATGPAPQDAPADAAANTPADDTGTYALLVNEKQLDTLLYNFNGDIPIDKTQLGRRAAFANQAAVVTKLDDGYLADTQRREAAPAEERSDIAQLSKAASKDYELALNEQGQAIELRLPPDLGSAYANDRNRSNLLQGKTNTALSYQAQLPPDDTPPQAATTAEHPDQTLPEARLVAGEEQAKSEDNTAPGATNSPELADADAVPLPKPTLQADPASEPERENAPLRDSRRGNWLAPHLPLADTTPIFTWRHVVAADPPQLVPITIRQAPPDEVRILRSRQQAVYGQAVARDAAQEVKAADEAEPADTVADEAKPAVEADAAEQESGEAK